MNDLENMQAVDARNWYENWYAPNNAIVVISGDVDPAKVRVLAEQYYGPSKTKTLPVRKPQVEPVQIGIKNVIVQAPADAPQITMAWKVPHLEPSAPDQIEPYALEVLGGVLDGYDNARLSRALVKQQRLVDGIDVSYNLISRGPQLFQIGATVAKGKTIAQTQAGIRQVLQEVMTQGVTEAELKRIKVRILANQIYKRDSIFGQAMEIGSAEIAGFSWRDLDLILERIQNVTSAQVQAVAKHYLIDAGLTIAVLEPQLRKKQISGTAAPGKTHLGEMVKSQWS